MDEVIQKAIDKLKEEHEQLKKGEPLVKERVILNLDGADAAAFRFLVALCDEDKKYCMIQNMFKTGVNIFLTEVIVVKKLEKALLENFGLF